MDGHRPTGDWCARGPVHDERRRRDCAGRDAAAIHGVCGWSAVSDAHARLGCECLTDYAHPELEAEALKLPEGTSLSLTITTHRGGESASVCRNRADYSSVPPRSSVVSRLLRHRD